MAQITVIINTSVAFFFASISLMSMSCQSDFVYPLIVPVPWAINLQFIVRSLQFIVHHYTARHFRYELYVLAVKNFQQLI